jgi:hypothetical protein
MFVNLLRFSEAKQCRGDWGKKKGNSLLDVNWRSQRSEVRGQRLEVRSQTQISDLKLKLKLEIGNLRSQIWTLEFGI